MPRHAWLLFLLPAAGCWIVAGVDDFVDAPAAGSANGGTGGSGASGGATASGGNAGAGGGTGACAVDPCAILDESVECTARCSAVFRCGLLSCGGGQLCPGFGPDMQQISEQAFVAGCAAECEQQPDLLVVDSCHCDALIAALQQDSATFASACAGGGCTDRGCADENAPDCVSGFCTCAAAGEPCGPLEKCMARGCSCGPTSSGPNGGAACTGPYPVCNGDKCVCTGQSCTDGFVCLIGGKCGCDEDTDCFPIQGSIFCDEQTSTCNCLNGTCLSSDQKCANGGGTCDCISGTVPVSPTECAP